MGSTFDEVITEARCGACVYGRRDGMGYWRCHRFPPVLIRDNAGLPSAERPAMSEDDWCGEFVKAKADA